ncbi:MAG: CotH kinase family protein, partial [Ruminococcus sp.]|nr:CotH kinase family protein [Ruminococcus sp.]
TEADLTDWNNLLKDVADGRTTYSQFAEKVDVQSFMDYFAAQIYWANADWPQNNAAVWRSNAIDETNPWSDGKWRMFLFDTESGQGLYGSEDKSVNADCFSRISRNQDDLSRAFTALMRDKDFSGEFARTFMDIANYNFSPEKTKELISFYQENFRQQILDSYERFYSKSLSGEKGKQRFEQEYRTISDFYQNRLSTAERTLRSAAGLSDKMYSVTINNTPDLGEVYFNTLKLTEEKQWSGKYHTDYAMTLNAQPREGASFSHWEITSGGKTENIAQASYSFTLAGDTTVTAVYGDAVRGDYSGDGQVNVADLVLLSKYLLGQKVDINNSADAEPDGVTNAFDMATLREIVTLN